MRPRFNIKKKDGASALGDVLARVQGSTELPPLQGLVADGECGDFLSFRPAHNVEATSSESDDDLGVVHGSGTDDNDSEADSAEEQRQVPHQLADDDGQASEDSADGSSLDGSSEGEGDGPAPSGHVAPRREKLAGVHYEQYLAVDVREAHLTLLTLMSPITLQGPCAVYGMGGETSLNGYLIGAKALVLASRGAQVTAAPVASLRSTASEGLEAPHTSASDPESLFGHINWTWVRGRLESLRRRLQSTVSVLLVAQHRDATSRRWFERGAERSVPSFIHNRRLYHTPRPLLDLIGRAAKHPSSSVAVVGEKDIGKSTLCKMIANAFVSQHGHAYWLDFDLGQPEFWLPGCFTLTRITAPIIYGEEAKTAHEVVWSTYLGTTTVSCPLTAARAIEAACAAATALGAFPLVINTHGWVRSAGRRSTVEALRRLRPRHTIHLARTGGEAADWTSHDTVGDPRNGLSAAVVQGRFWPSERLCAMPPPADTPPAPSVAVIDASTRPTRREGKKRGRDESDAEDNAPPAAHAVAGAGRFVTVFHLMSSYPPKGNNRALRQRRWHDYLRPIRHEDTSCELAFDLHKLTFVALASVDPSCAALTDKRSLHALLHRALVGVAVGPALGAGAGHAVSLASLGAAPQVLVFGLVTDVDEGSITVAVPLSAEAVGALITPHKGSIGIIVGTADRGDYSSAVTMAISKID